MALTEQDVLRIRDDVAAGKQNNQLKADIITVCNQLVRTFAAPDSSDTIAELEAENERLAAELEDAKQLLAAAEEERDAAKAALDDTGDDDDTEEIVEDDE